MAHSCRVDLAFAHSSIITRDVAGSDFKYAKIMTLPFFGSGVVELPPEGYKRAKNSRKMQMCFFVHEGKVMVEVGAGDGGETNQFAISKGGVWVVPRGKTSFFPISSAVLSGSALDCTFCTLDLERGRLSTAMLAKGGDSPLEHMVHCWRPGFAGWSCCAMGVCATSRRFSTRFHGMSMYDDVALRTGVRWPILCNGTVESCRESENSVQSNSQGLSPRVVVFVRGYSAFAVLVLHQRAEQRLASFGVWECCMLTLFRNVTGNNYGITNESRTTTARIFFAQGCEVDALSQ